MVTPEPRILVAECHGGPIFLYGIGRYSMLIRYQFSPETAVQATGYLLSKLGGRCDKVKLMKLLYLADRDHFLSHGRPITGDSQWALPFGPLPSRTLNMFAGLEGESSDFALTHIEAEPRQYVLKADPGQSMLSDSDRAILDAVIAAHGQKHTWKIKDETHRLPEYEECRVPGSSAPIPYEVILKHHGGEQRFRRNRAVITPEMAAHMLCPFAASEPDL